MSLCTVISSCSTKTAKPADPINETPAKLTGLPDITLIGPDGSQFSTNTLPGKTILIFFGADCDHCQREAQQIQRNLKEFDAHTLYFISMDPFPVIHKFAQTYGLQHQPNVHFVRADGGSVFRSMGYMKTPTICVYAANKSLTKRFDGETKIEAILKVL
jgi:cytochrome oxidase Cu insertion factor (SCO1/SenC/PrrC family)